MKRVYLIHGWEGNPKNNWFPWLKSKLEEQGFEVLAPAMPHAEAPNRMEWTTTLHDLILNPDEETFLVGHSMGCQAIQRYLETLSDDKIIGGAVLVAGWINDPRWEGRTEEEIKVVKDWFDVPKDYEKIKNHCKKFISIFSTNDPFISQPNWKEASEILGSEVVMAENKSHFDDEAGIKELPEAFGALIEMSK
ncbi:MAG: alpha/beta hydrolase [Candidatus Doudnabacteria bacterium]|nr:alpha/beta hydrolase [Candidatus Doudnabacteria bacterium]